MQNDRPSYDSLPSGLGPASFGPFDQVFEDLPSFPTASEQPEERFPDPGFITPLPLAFEPLMDLSAGPAAAAGEQNSESSPSRSSASAEPAGAAFGDVSYMAGQSLAASAGMPGRSERREQSTMQLSGYSEEHTASVNSHHAATSQQPPPSEGTAPAEAAQRRSEAPAEPPAWTLANFPTGPDRAQAEPMAADAISQQAGLMSMSSAPPDPSMVEAADQASPSTLAVITQAAEFEDRVAEAEHMAESEGRQGTAPALAGYAGLAPESHLPTAGASLQPSIGTHSTSAAQALPQQAFVPVVHLLDMTMLPGAAALPGPDNARDEEIPVAEQHNSAPDEQPASPPGIPLGMSKAQAKHARQAAARARAAQGAQQSGQKRGWQEWLGKGPGEPQRGV